MLRWLRDRLFPRVKTHTPRAEDAPVFLRFPVPRHTPKLELLPWPGEVAVDLHAEEPVRIPSRRVRDAVRLMRTEGCVSGEGEGI